MEMAEPGGPGSSQKGSLRIGVIFMPEQLPTIFDPLAKKLRELNLPFEYQEIPFEDEKFRFLAIQIPCGRNSRRVMVGENGVQEFCESQALSYRRIEGFDAIWSEAHSRIECRMRAAMSSVRSTVQRLSEQLDSKTHTVLFEQTASDDSEAEDERPRREFLSFTLPPPEGVQAVSIGKLSKELRLLCGPPQNTYSLTIEVPVTSHDEAKSKLERIGNAVLFNLDLTHQTRIFLQPERTRRQVMSPPDQVSQKINGPRLEYDGAALSLYWYAQTAFQMPLLRFLAFYQILEFYFPVFVEKEARNQLRTILRDPRFDPNRDSDVAHLVSQLRESLGDQGRVEERKQLVTTIKGCVSEIELSDFLKEDNARSTYFASKECTALSKTKLVLERADKDLRNDVAIRIYDIRCRIVHTKGEGEQERLLLPFSADLNDLYFDIDLLEFLAVRSILSNARPFVL
jgi:hypothetical protein